MLRFPIHFVTSFRDSLDLEMKCISLDFISNGNIEIYFIIMSSLCLLLTSCQKSERHATFPLCLHVCLSGADSRFVYTAGKVKMS